MSSIKTQPNLSNRIGSTIIDYLLYYALLFIYLYKFGEATETGYSVSEIKGLPPIIFWVLYFPFIESLYGQTLGHKIIGLKVISQSGGPVNFTQSFKRRFLDPIDILGTMGIAAIVSIKNSPLNQRIGDMFAKTLVVGKEVGRCSHCSQKVVLEPSDTIKGRFTCPHCSQKSTLELF